MVLALRLGRKGLSEFYGDADELGRLAASGPRGAAGGGRDANTSRVNR